MVDFDADLYCLSKSFYCDHPVATYPEILTKDKRVYNVAVVEYHDYFVCIPFRTEISHRYCYRFKKSNRSKKHRSGIDYVKMVIIKKIEYLDISQTAIIDTDEKNEYKKNIEKINRGAIQFLDDYISHCKKKNQLSPEEFRRRYQYSSLIYFHTELGIEKI